MYQKQHRDSYYPKRPLHSFQDLEVYQKALECSVLVAKQVNEYLTVAECPSSDIARYRGKAVSLPKLRTARPQGAMGTGSMASTAGNIGSATVQNLILHNMLPCALGIPHQVAEAHSLRFGDHTAGIAAIEKAMLNCNKMIVYLEQFRDICDTDIPWEFFDEVIKKYLYVRRKMLHLEQAWKKFMPGHKAEV